MKESGPENQRATKPLDWRKLLPHVLVVSLDEASDVHEASARNAEHHKGLASLLDRVAQAAARKGVDFEEMAAPILRNIEQEEREGKITPGQAEFLRDESDALSCMINWAYDEGMIDQQMRSTLRETVN